MNTTVSKNRIIRLCSFFSSGLFGLCLLLSLVTSCRKDSFPGPCTGSNPNYPTELVIDDTSAVKRWNIDLTLQGIYHFEAIYQFDVNHDEITDFEVSHLVSDGGGGGGASFDGVLIQSTSPDSYFRLQKVDTLFTYTDTTYYGLDPVNAVIITHSDCYDTGNPGTIMNLRGNISFANPGDIIHKSDDWGNKTWHFLHGPTHYYSQTTSEWYSSGNDTLWSTVIDSARSCEIIPLNAVTYIPVKTSTCGTERMGWIKLELGANTEVVYIREYAIQK